MKPIDFDNSFARLPERFFARLPPTPVAEPRLIALNTALATEMGVDPEYLASPTGVSMLAGNHIPEGATPLAQAYAGHQFGGWSPQLGDGRAILLGETISQEGERLDIQLKGSGPTPFSRMGDGRAWLGPVLREYIVSETMHVFGVPTTRALAAVSTGEDIFREGAVPGAILTRVASSHIRVGTFQFFAARQDEEALSILLNYAQERHFPGKTGALSFLRSVVERQAQLIAHWMSLGFIHGVMNTDNCHVGGLTIDYGPCAFMDNFDPARVFSSIDQNGRYAFMRQPDMAIWNLAQLATSLLPLMGDRDKAIEQATAAIHEFPDLYQRRFCKVFGRKLGLEDAGAEDEGLIVDFLDLMKKHDADFTNSFRGLSDDKMLSDFHELPDVIEWKDRLKRRWATASQTELEAKKLMYMSNPAIIPRNHRIEELIQAAVAGDFGPFERIMAALSQPFDPPAEFDDIRAAPKAEERVQATFCGT